jgi:sialic acid synthase SpsE
MEEFTTHSDSIMADKPEGKEKEEQHQDVELVSWRKKMEMIGIDIKSLDRENETRRLKLRTTLMNQHFINELDKIGLQLIKITAGSIFTRGLLVLLEPKSTKMLTE